MDEEQCKNPTSLNHFDWILLMMVTEVIGRVMTSTDLSAKGLLKTIVPTVYREDYMDALRNLRGRGCDAYVNALPAYEFSATLVGDSS